jgi:hypothetical protein
VAHVEAVIILLIALAGIIVLDMAANALGVDSREGFADDRPPPGLR